MTYSLLQRLRAVPRGAAVSLILLFCAGAADGVLVPFFPLWATQDAGISVGLIGLLFACYAGGELLATPFLGGIADRVGRRPVLIASATGVGLGIAGLSLVHGALPAAGVLLFTGVCESVLHPTLYTVVADVTPPEAHRRWFSLAHVWGGAGAVLGPLIGAGAALLSLQSVFLVAGTMLVIGGVIAWRCLPETRGAHADAEGEDDDEIKGLLAALRDPRMARLLGWVVIFGICSSWMETVIPLYAHDAGTLSPAGVGLLFCYGAVLCVVFQLLVTHYSRAWLPKLLALCAGAASVLGFALLWGSPTALALIGAVTLYAVSDMLIAPLVPTAVVAVAPPASRASYMAAVSVTSDLKGSLGPSIGTALYAVMPRLPWMIGIPLVAIAALGLGRALTHAHLLVEDDD